MEGSDCVCALRVHVLCAGASVAQLSALEGLIFAGPSGLPAAPLPFASPAVGDNTGLPRHSANRQQGAQDTHAAGSGRPPQVRCVGASIGLLACVVLRALAVCTLFTHLCTDWTTDMSREALCCIVRRSLCAQPPTWSHGLVCHVTLSPTLSVAVQTRPLDPHRRLQLSPTPRTVLLRHPLHSTGLRALAGEARRGARVVAALRALREDRCVVSA